MIVLVDSGQISLSLHLVPAFQPSLYPRRPTEPFRDYRALDSVEI
jgi:hypothetical protein